ncbi:MAG TPA: hypothetical protein VFY06_15615, partial [Verrucomicrobiae bacterium]|nr:hypothetical protein [Verrucomicrobiae bacterium]
RNSKAHILTRRDAKMGCKDLFPTLQWDKFSDHGRTPQNAAILRRSRLHPSLRSLDAIADGYADGVRTLLPDMISASVLVSTAFNRETGRF